MQKYSTGEDIDRLWNMVKPYVTMTTSVYSTLALLAISR